MKNSPSLAGWVLVGRVGAPAVSPASAERKPGTGTSTGYAHPTVGNSVGPYQLPVPGHNYPETGYVLVGWIGRVQELLPFDLL